MHRYGEPKIFSRGREDIVNHERRDAGGEKRLLRFSWIHRERI